MVEEVFYSYTFVKVFNDSVKTPHSAWMEPQSCSKKIRFNTRWPLSFPNPIRPTRHAHFLL